MHERFTRLGIAPAFHAHARHFMTLAKAWGMADADVEAHLSFAAQLPDRLTDESIAARYAHFVRERGLDPALSDLAISWRDEVVERGIECPPAEPAAITDADRMRLVQIRTEMSKPIGESYYWRSDTAGESMRDEYLALIERMGAAADAPFTPPATGDDTARKAEIETAMRQGSHGPYWASDAMQNEYRAILGREARGGGN